MGSASQRPPHERRQARLRHRLRCRCPSLRSRSAVAAVLRLFTAPRKSSSPRCVLRYCRSIRDSELCLDLFTHRTPPPRQGMRARRHTGHNETDTQPASFAAEAQRRLPHRLLDFEPMCRGAGSMFTDPLGAGLVARKLREIPWLLLTVLLRLPLLSPPPQSASPTEPHRPRTATRIALSIQISSLRSTLRFYQSSGCHNFEFQGPGFPAMGKRSLI